MRQLLIIAAVFLGAAATETCGPGPAPSSRTPALSLDRHPRYSCNSPCGSNIECRSTIGNECTQCYFGRCSRQTIPEPPTAP